MFQGLDGREVVGRFDGGEITSNAGGVLLRDVEQRTWILGRLSECFTDHRDLDRIEHSVDALIKQRILGLCLGYEDRSDHDELCRDRLLACCMTGTISHGGLIILHKIKPTFVITVQQNGRIVETTLVQST